MEWPTDLRSIFDGAVAARREAPTGVGRVRPLEDLARRQARRDLTARPEGAFDTESMALAMRDGRQRVQPHTWRAFQRQVLDRCSGIDVAAELGVCVKVVDVACHKVTRMIRETVRRLGGADESDQAE